MMALRDWLLGSKETTEYELGEGKALPDDSAPVGIRTPEVGERINKTWLEAYYRRDADTFSAINHRVRTFMSSKYEVRADSDKVVSWFTEFLKNARYDIILRKIALHNCIYGNAWVELVYNEERTSIVGFDHLDPKVMDFARDSNGNILFDKQNNPQYYVQKLPDNVEVPEEKRSRLVTQDGGIQGLKLKTDEVAHFAMYTIGDDLDGIGLIEPMYNPLLSKIQMEKDWGIAVKKAASPLLVAKYGDERHPPVKSMEQELLKECKDINSKSVFVIPYFNDLDYRNVNLQSLEPNLAYYVDKVSASTGVPRPYVVGSGDKTPRSTFKGLNLGYERDIREMQNSISYDSEVQMFSLLSAQQKFGEIPKLEFEYPSIEFMDAKMSRIVELTNAGLLFPDKQLRQLIREMENLPPEPDEITDEMVTAMKREKEEKGDND